MKNKVLVVATSSKTRGGITSVIKAYRDTGFWSKWNCLWIETHIDKSILLKFLFFTRAIILFIYNLPITKLTHFHLSGPISLKRKYLLIYLSKFFKKKVIIHFHAFGEKPQIENKYKDLYFNAFRCADKIIVLSESWKQNIQTDFNLDDNKVKVLYNPCPNIKLSKSIQKEKIILFAGTLNKRKNYKSLIEAFSLISEKHKDWKIILAGNGEIGKAEALSARLGIKEKVECIGWLNGEAKHNLFSRSSIFCLPSFAEGFPMAVLDAWAYNLPVISSPVGGIPDIAIHNQNISLIDPYDVKNISLRIDELIEDRNLQNKLINSAKEFSSKTFSLVYLEEELNIIYTDLLSNKKVKS